MRIVAQNYRSGELRLLKVPAPACRPGGVLVRTEYSLISAGTEMMKVNESKLSLIGKARARPDQVRKVLATLAQQGPAATYRKVMGQLDSYTPLGYSLCGVVEEVGEGAEEFSVGQRVACGGNTYALHAELNWVPVNLCVPVPNATLPEHAAFTTVGAIAMQGFRQAEARLGETACVVGLGLVGQLLAQILRAAGVKTFGVDIDPERCALAERLGASGSGVPGQDSLHAMRSRIAEATGGHGCDSVFLCAAGGDNAHVHLAAELARDRGRVVDIGKVRLDLPWKEYYEKELDVRFSRSYGPGRYDPLYEEAGVDYPIGYVRWTERRNMECFVDLVGSGAVTLAPLVDHIVPFEQAESAYEGIRTGSIRGVGILFQYPAQPDRSRSVVAPAPRGPAARRTAASREVVRIGAIGCGNYASSMLLPHLKNRPDVALCEVVTRSSLSAANAAKQHGFERASTDPRRLLDDASVNAVLVLTRHASHAALVCEALRAGKAVFVEKPLALGEEQLDQIVRTVRETGNDRLMVGFNRRFAPLLVQMRRSWGPAAGPLVVNYRVNAGTLAPTSWYADAAEGGRFVGEGCHFVDTVSWWIGQDPVEVSAVHASDDPDNLVATYRYPDGSLGVVSYLTAGDPRFPKEMMEVFGGGAVAKLDNFARAEVWRDGRARVKRSPFQIDKGQRAEMDALVRAVRTGEPMPIPFPSLVATTRATFATLGAARDRAVKAIAPLTDAAEPRLAPPPTVVGTAK
jgi:predicted dehydrogenase/threonine dehydrogenase-like Zn-dependent dehydrogenase